jgi:hypothetical protein
MRKKKKKKRTLPFTVNEEFNYFSAVCLKKSQSEKNGNFASVQYTSKSGSGLSPL